MFQKYFYEKPALFCMDSSFDIFGCWLYGVELFTTQSTFNNLEKEAFSPFPTMFFTIPKPNFNLSVTFKLLSPDDLNLDQPIILLFGKQLMPFSTAFQLYRGNQCTYPCVP